jgi:predicted pyridoxine 5'-phosphate oxidase superfamily flavin-nucleotide-binding protein
MIIFALYCASVLLVQGVPSVQGQNVQPIGNILSIDSAARRIAIKTDAGPEMIISFEDATRFLRVAPGAQDLQNAASISVSDLAVADRILARGRAVNPGLFAATSIIVMSKGDIARKQAAERADWEKRGVGGVITVLDLASNEITISAAGSKPMVIAFTPGAVLRRYASNSVKFSDALPSRFDELRVGDQVKARGTSNEDRSRFVAEELVSGSFRTIAATVVASDPGQGTIQITDLATNKRMQTTVTADSTVRRLSAEVAQMLASRIQGAKTSSSSSELQSAIEKLPHLSIADLKPGEAIILACTSGDDPSHATAITLLAGAEPLFKSKGGKALDLGSWNLDLNMNVGVP